MTKCEQAQKGLDELIDRLKQLLQDSLTSNLLQDKAADKSYSIRIRVTIVQILRSIQHYGNHMQGLSTVVPPLTRISYRESQEQIELTDEEKLLDDKRIEEELEILGSIGFKNAKEPYFKFPESIGKIDQMCRDICQKLYVGENAQYLVGPEKIPTYLTIFLEKMKRQAEEFKIN